MSAGRTTTSSSDPAHSERIYELVRAQLLELGLVGIDASAISRDALLIEDLGLDSLKFVDLTLGLETTVGIAEFPMQDWIDRQLATDSPLSVAELVRACEELSCGTWSP